MAQEINKPQAVYTKLGSAAASSATSASPSSSGSKGKPKKTLFGMEVRSLGAVLGLTLFFVVAMAGVVISLRQYFVRDRVSPEAPESIPAAAEPAAANCTLGFVVTEQPPTPSPVPSPTPDVTPTPIPSVSPTPGVTPTPTPSVSPTPGVTPTPTPSISPSPGVTPSPTPSVSPSPTPPVSHNVCNDQNQCVPVDGPGSNECSNSDNCVTVTHTECIDNQCQTVNGSGSNECSNNANCQPSNPTHTVCSNNQCVTVSGTGTNQCANSSECQPVIGCNDLCNTNADCSNVNHICYTTADGTNRCRLDQYPASSDCRVPVTTTTTTTTTTKGGQPVAAQPALPEELPQAGPDWVGYLKVGLGVLGGGLVLLLLL